ncbi:SymE family type I addiction module toxin [Kordia jejudonensis]|uniref:SymE family type I addiction module toxin n=1 Tax=Kordia jejudonensis TaxID=1348245 RepID=UPI000629A96F|nr:SymE family type I addiction module toxin [Kordia jejudonensis]
MEKTRKLKIHSKFREREYDRILIPTIRLEGKWLENLGFTTGNEVVIHQQKNKLVIALDKSEV